MKLLTRNHRVKASRKALMEALRGRVSTHSRFMLKLHLDTHKDLQEKIVRLEAQIDEALRPYEEAAALLVTIPGVVRQRVTSSAKTRARSFAQPMRRGLGEEAGESSGRVKSSASCGGGGGAAGLGMTRSRRRWWLANTP